MAGIVGIQQMARTQGVVWGNGASNDQHVWFDENGWNVDQTESITGNLKVGQKITNYNGVVLGGLGVPAIVVFTRPAAQTNTLVTLATYTTPAVDGSYQI